MKPISHTFFRFVASLIFVVTASEVSIYCDTSGDALNYAQMTNSFTGVVAVSETVDFTPTASMTVRHHRHSAILLSTGDVLIVKYRDRSETQTIPAELYVTASDVFTTTGSPMVARTDYAATLLPNGKVLIVGGYVGLNSHTSAELYDPTTGVFSITGSMMVGRYFHTVTLLPNGKVLVTGGRGEYGQLASAELYDPVSGTFSTTGSLITARGNHKATLLLDGRVLITGGHTGDGINLASAELYDPATGTFTTTGSTSVSFSHHTSTMLPNGDVLIAGGVTTYGGSLTAEVYDPETGTFSPTGNITRPRCYHTATLLPNGKVLITGGFNDFSAELYDPDNGSFTPVYDMTDIRLEHRATLLPNDKVLITGGRRWFPGGDLASAELGTILPSNVFTGTLVLPSGWITESTANVTLGGATAAAALEAGSLSNDGTSWGDWIAVSMDTIVTTTWDFGDDGANKPVYLRLRDENRQRPIVVTGTVNVDTLPPTSAMAAIPDISSSETIPLTWTGSDETSGIADYDLQVRNGTSGEWVDLLTNTIATSTVYTGTVGETYYFRIRATDNAGNLEPWPETYDMFTLVGVGSEYGFTINNGALFTNQTAVMLTISAKPGTVQMQASNDGGFAGAEWEPYAPLKAWTITQYGNYVIPRVVYVRYKDVEGSTSATYQDDIVLDVTAPTGSVEATPGVSGGSLRVTGARAAAMHPVTISATDDYPYAVYLPLVLNGFCTLPTGPANVTLHLQATDDVSGIADMMISHLPNCECGRWEPYLTTKAWYVPEETTTIYVKFRDSAGNVSEVVTDTISW